MIGIMVELATLELATPVVVLQCGDAPILPREARSELKLTQAISVT